MAKLTPEGKIKKAVRDLLKEYGVTYIKTPTTAGYGTSGDFDIRCVFYGLSIGIETKATADDMPTMLQTKNAFEHYEAGGISLCIHAGNLKVLRDVLDRAHSMYGARIDWPPESARKYIQQQKGNDDVTVTSEGSK